MEDNYPELQKIAEALAVELCEHYPESFIDIHRLQAPGYAVEIRPRMNCSHRLMVKIINDSILFDWEGIITRDHRRLKDIDINNPDLFNQMDLIINQLLSNNWSL